jgi:2-hydroxychromene-2-carboxylate isomerase
MANASDPIFWFDFGSPNAYLAWKVLPQIEARTGARFHQVPILLGGLFKATGNQAPMLAFANVPAKLAYENRQIFRFIERHGLQQFRMNPHFPVNTLGLMRGAVAARHLGVFEPYLAAIYRFMWEEPRKLDDPAILAATLAEAGLPADQLLAAAQTPEVKAELATNTDEAVAKGAFGAPSFFVKGELLFGKDRLPDVEELLQAS